MPFTGDQHPVQALAAGAADLAIGDRVRARPQHRRPDGTHSDGGELVPVTDQELELCGLIAKIREQVAGRPDLLTQPPETPLAPDLGDLLTADGEIVMSVDTLGPERRV